MNDDYRDTSSSDYKCVIDTLFWPGQAILSKVVSWNYPLKQNKTKK